MTMNVCKIFNIKTAHPVSVSGISIRSNKRRQSDLLLKYYTFIDKSVNFEEHIP